MADIVTASVSRSPSVSPSPGMPPPLESPERDDVSDGDEVDELPEQLPEDPPSPTHRSAIEIESPRAADRGKRRRMLPALLREPRLNGWLRNRLAVITSAPGHLDLRTVREVVWWCSEAVCRDTVAVDTVRQALADEFKITRGDGALSKLWQVYNELLHRPDFQGFYALAVMTQGLSRMCVHKMNWDPQGPHYKLYCGMVCRWADVLDREHHQAIVRRVGGSEPHGAAAEARMREWLRSRVRRKRPREEGEQQQVDG
eukprot:TRINITY_DN1424_c1_g1_i1.p1 TRINITY_DN1424_c1_g1~~TRINITY_DN1424_c1_g1_i1.p1  ORF type:complete len:294 (+),score=38.97 TRINITY_DN1424_c1_g1_i1:112-882(+)